MPTTDMSSTRARTPDQVDVRGPRFAAWLTATALAAALLLWPVSPAVSAVVLCAQATVFAIGAWRGPRSHPYGQIFARLVAPRLGPVGEKEPVAPLRFAQLVGLAFAVAGVVGFASGLPLLGLIATAFALVAAFLNAAFGICLGCRIYPLVARVRRKTSAPSPA
ncbi:hypothetical protein AU193_19105 [Mycobacterium sp. GA-1285]|uniref:DUF4395 domain-containing protein n=1 Tax=Mycobacterium sp. GA-1285 TaxID=1772282 RepID=UPI00074B2CBB|nr:DUF4395 domain-containing protein [Mycobacterium sp. GA-1285]KUI11522.1 hypothetical protein AU193_19105 [Mycobacterium sp. GA-1285]